MTLQLALAHARTRLHTLAPICASATVAATLLLCVLCTKISGQYVGGLAWPYVADLARDAPSYYVLCLGTLAVAALFALSWRFNYQFQSAVLMDPVDGLASVPRAATRLLYACVALGMLAPLGLVLLAFFSATSFPSVHSFAAHWVLVLGSVAVFLNTFVSYKIQKLVESTTDPVSYTLDGVNPAPPSAEMVRLQKLQRTFHVQFACATAFFVAMLLYVPVGLAVIQDAQHLSIDECLARDLGDAYCTRTMKLDVVDTKLWTYEDDFAAHQMRAIAQLGCILTLVGYTLSFAAHAYDDELAKLTSRGIAPSTHFYSLAVIATPPPGNDATLTT